MAMAMVLCKSYLLRWSWLHSYLNQPANQPADRPIT